jgi:hypothetical protein
MEQIKTLSEDAPAAKEPEKSRPVLSYQWVPSWQEFEAKIREHRAATFLLPWPLVIFYRPSPSEPF